MAIQLPDWYEGGFPSAEGTMRAILMPFLELCDPVPEVYSVLPKNYAELLPMVTIFRGAGEGDCRMDYPQIQVWAICERREEAEELAEYMRQIVHSYTEATSHVFLEDGTKSIILGARETKGPTMTAATIPDQRIAFFTYELSLKKSGKPDYARVRKELFN